MVEGIENPVPKVALIVGVTGLVGKELATILARSGWKVYGVARNPPDPLPHRYQFISCDLLDPMDTMDKLSGLMDTTHLFWITWASQFPLDSQECYNQNKDMMSHALVAILPRAKALKHVCLQTGTRHYMYEERDGTSNLFDEGSPRDTNVKNSFYALEDLLGERLAAGTVGWSVHRPGILIGGSRRVVFNFLGSLCVYGSICRHLNLPFIFGGHRENWEHVYMDASDAGLVARQEIWAATSNSTAAAKGEAINGSHFTWKKIWPALAEKFRLVVPENRDDSFSAGFSYASFLADKRPVREEIVEKEGLVGTKMGELANGWLLDGMFRMPRKMLASRKKVDMLGFTSTSILNWVDCMRDEKLIP